jgi:alpha-1,2-mannosyltransferase
MAPGINSDEQSRTAPPARGDDPYAICRFLGNAVALLVVALSVWEWWRNFAQPTDRDFLGVWAAAQLAVAGKASAVYDSGVLHAVEAAAATFGSAAAELPFPYAPAYLLLVMPLAALSFPVAMALWSLCTSAFYVFAARRLMPRSGWLAIAFPAAFANAAIGQNGFLTAGIFMAGLSLLSSAPFAAGLLLGCLAIKPQLALLLPVALIAGRQWRAVAGAAMSSTGILLAGVAAFGPAATAAWLHQGQFIVDITSKGLMGWSKLASVYATARQIGFAPEAAIAIHLAVAAAGAAVTWRIWRSQAAQEVKVAVLAAASMLMSPYVFYYDGLVLVPAFFYLVRKHERPGLLLALWSVPLLLMVGIGLGGVVNLNPIVPIVLTMLIYRSWNAAKPMREGRNLTFEQPSGVRLSQRVWR